MPSSLRNLLFCPIKSPTRRSPMPQSSPTLHSPPVYSPPEVNWEKVGVLNLKLEGPLIEHGNGDWSDTTALSIFQRLLEPSGDLAVPEAANLIVTFLLDKAPKNREGYEGNLYQFVTEIAEQLPYTHAGHAKLARLMTSLATSSKTTWVAKAEGSFEATWNFKILRRELGLNIPGKHIPSNTMTIELTSFAAHFEDPSECPEHLNQLAFYAHLTNERFFPDMYWAFASFSVAFENHPSHGLTDWQLDCTVSSAAIWIIIAGQTIWNQLVVSPAATLAITEYKNTKMDVERWIVWRKGFEAIVNGEKPGMGEEARKLSKKAAGLMLAIEENMTWD